MGRSVADWARGAADAQWRRRACQACGVSARGTVRAKLCRLPGPRVWVSVDGTWAGMTVGLSEVRTAGGFGWLLVQLGPYWSSNKMRELGRTWCYTSKTVCGWFRFLLA